MVLCVACVAGAGGYAAVTIWRARAAAPVVPVVPIARLDSGPRPPGAETGAGPAPLSPPGGSKPLAFPRASRPASERRALDPAASAPRIREDVGPRAVGPEPALAPAPRSVLFRSTALGESYGRISLAHLDAKDAPRYVTPLRCDRVHFAAGQGLCLEAKRGVVTTFRAHLFDEEFRIRRTLPLDGVPSRARLSPDGRRAAMTVFVSGHSYESADFSTRTTVVDAASGEILVADLEAFVVLRDGSPFKSADFNFWGVTFARDSDRFFATLGTGGRFYLIEGDLAARQARVVREGVECPSLSPDNTRVAFKQRVGVGERFGRFAWRLHVLDLATLADTPLLGETRSVDDQVEWLDDRRIVYALPADVPHATAATNTWVLAADGRGTPRLLLPLAFSPAVVR